MPVELGMGLDERVSPSLHPQNIASMDVYVDESAQALEPTLNAFKDTYSVLSKVWDAREAAASNPTWNEAQQVLETWAFAEKQMTRAVGWFDNVRQNLANGIAAMEQDLTRAVTTAAANPVAAEVRAYVKGLPTGKVMGFLQQAIDSGDDTTATAILSAPPYLSGIDPGMQKHYLRVYNEVRAPATAQRLKSFKAAAAMLDERKALIVGEFERAAGANIRKIKALREAKTASERAFVLHET